MTEHMKQTFTGEDLTGKRFGAWKVLAYAGDQAAGSFWAVCCTKCLFVTGRLGTHLRRGYRIARCPECTHGRPIRQRRSRDRLREFVLALESVCHSRSMHRGYASREQGRFAEAADHLSTAAALIAPELLP